MKRAVLVILVLTVLVAGCSSPEGGEDTETDGADPTIDETTVTDNEQGAEPVNPPNDTTATNETAAETDG